MPGVSINNETRFAYGKSRLAFSKIAKELLPDWEVSLVFVGPAKALSLNKKLRKKSYVPNVLSYVVGDKNCEIIICPSEAKKQAPAYGLTPSAYCLYLFIHGALHIKGWVHGVKMNKCEQKLVTKYGTENNHRHRHRDVPSKNGRSRRGV